MKPRDRVLAAIENTAVDRVPFDYLAVPEIDSLLMQHLRVGDIDRVKEALSVDLRHVNPPYIGPPIAMDESQCWKDIWGVVRKKVPFAAGSYNETVFRPMAETESLEQVDRYPWPNPDWFDYGALKTLVKDYSDYAIVLGSPSVLDLINGTSHARGMENLLVDIATRSPVGVALLQRRYEFWLEYISRCLEVLGSQTDIVFIGDDYGGQESLLINPDSWEELFAPKLKTIFNLAHRHGCKTMLHSCGSNCLLLPRLIELGLDVFQTVQPEAKGMEIGRLMSVFGGRVAFHGSISIQATLPFGSRDDVRKEVDARISLGLDHGGLIVSPAHNIQADTPINNILELYGSLERRGRRSG